MNNDADNDHVDVIAASGGGDIHDHVRHACNTSRTTITNKDTSSKAHSVHTNYEEQLTTKTSMMLIDMSAATNTRHRAASNTDDERLHNGRAIYTTTSRNQHETRHCTETDTTMIGMASNKTSFAARSRTATNQQATEQITNNPPTIAHVRPNADPINSYESFDMNSATPQNQRTATYGATRMA